METLHNCPIILSIHQIDTIIDSDETYLIRCTGKDRKVYQIVFTYVWDVRRSIENGNIDRIVRWRHQESEESSVLQSLDSEYLRFFAEQSAGTLPLNELKHFIVYDEIDTVVDILTTEEPVLQTPASRYLPLGTIVGLKTGSPDIEPKSLMIIGRYQTDTGTGKTYDYSAVPYPEGNLGPHATILFNQTDIAWVTHYGFTDERDATWQNTLHEHTNHSGDQK